MRKLTILLTLAVMTAAATRAAHATCASGFTLYLAGQVPDFTFTSGVPATIHFKPWYVDFQSTSGSCGIFARSTTPGVSIQPTYGCPGNGCPISPPGEWAAVGDAYQTSLTALAQKPDDIPIIFDGTAPAGTYGTIEIAIRDNDLGIPSQAVIGTANVFIESATPPLTWFTVVTTADNVSGDRMILDHPYLNANPDANLFVSHVRNPGGSPSGTSWAHPIAAEYDGVLQQWTVVNTDAAAMPTGLGFELRIDPTAQRYCTPRVHGSYPYVVVANPLSDNNVWATLLVTPISGGPNPIAVQYVSPSWRIVYSDGAAMSSSTCFSVKVFSFSQYLGDPASGDLSSRANITADWGTGVDVSGFGTGHNSGAFRILEFDWALNNPYRQMMVTYNLTPLGFTPAYDPTFVGMSSPRAISFNARWSVYHEDGTTMPLNSRYNVWAPCAAGAWYPDADGDGWGGPGDVQASCAPLAGYASRGGDCDDGNATRYPGSQEVNDGQDNQCPGEPGYGSVDEISGTASFSDSVTFCWPGQSGATSYEVARSGHASFSPCNYVLSTSSTCLTDATVPPPGQALFYVVSAQTPFPGSWGTNSGGQERLLSCQ